MSRKQDVFVHVPFVARDEIVERLNGAHVGEQMRIEGPEATQVGRAVAAIAISDLRSTSVTERHWQ